MALKDWNLRRIQNATRGHNFVIEKTKFDALFRSAFDVEDDELLDENEGTDSTGCTHPRIVLLFHDTCKRRVLSGTSTKISNHTRHISRLSRRFLRPSISRTLPRGARGLEYHPRFVPRIRTDAIRTDASPIAPLLRRPNTPLFPVPGSLSVSAFCFPTRERRSSWTGLRDGLRDGPCGLRWRELDGSGGEKSNPELRHRNRQPS